MLHIILGILKIVGIVAAVIFLLILLAFLAVVFVPVRYRADIFRKETEFHLKLRVSWLFHIISAVVLFDINDGADICIRLFGFRLPFFVKTDRKKSGRKKQGSREKKNKNTGEKQSKAVQKERPEQSVRAEQRQTADISRDRPGRNAGERKDTDTRGFSEPTAQADMSRQLPPQDETESRREADGRENAEERREAGRREKTEERREDGGWKKAAGRIYALVQWISARIRLVIKLFTEFPAGLGKVWRKILVLLQQPERLLALAEEYEILQVQKELSRYLKYLLHHYRLRRITGYMRFGTNDPAMTGQMTGLLYLILPAKAERFDLIPEFTEAVFETDVSFAGYIRICHILRVGWAGFCNKRLRKVIRYVRRKQ